MKERGLRVCAQQEFKNFWIEEKYLSKFLHFLLVDSVISCLVVDFTSALQYKGNFLIEISNSQFQAILLKICVIYLLGSCLSSIYGQITTNSNNTLNYMYVVQKGYEEVSQVPPFDQIITDDNVSTCASIPKYFIVRIPFYYATIQSIFRIPTILVKGRVNITIKFDKFNILFESEYQNIFSTVSIFLSIFYWMIS